MNTGRWKDAWRASGNDRGGRGVVVLGRQRLQRHGPSVSQ